MSDLREDLAEDIRELDCYTPDFFRDKWDHDGIIARLDAIHGRLLDVAEEAREIVSPDYSDDPGPYAEGVRIGAMRRLMGALDRLEEVRRET